MRVHLVIGSAFALVIAFAPAQARRTAIDQNPETGNPINYTIGGYCDINGDDCGTIGLGYTVKLGSGAALDSIAIHGNGILSFGSAIDFNGYASEEGPSFAEQIGNGEPPAPASYGLNLVSVGQNIGLDFQSYAFLQSARVNVSPLGKITAQWFTCFTPTSSSSCPDTALQTLTLTPGKNGFTALITGAQAGYDSPGYVIDGVFTPQAFGTSFLIPAEFTGLEFPSGVPEPASWAMLIAGFGLTGAALRRRRAVAATA